MKQIETGMFAVSMAGHDKGKCYLIWKTEGAYVYLVDGRIRLLENPKKKKLKHVSIVYRMPEDWNPEKISDDDVRRAVRQYKKSLQA